jgi:serine/threonine protein kinase
MSDESPSQEPDLTRSYAPPAPPVPGERFVPGAVLAGRYRFVAPLGRGGMGEVWRADDLKLGRPVAVKAVRADVAESPEHLARLEREARLLAALSHPHVATLYSVEADGSARFLVMELVTGQTLAARLARGPLSAPEAIPLAGQLADAMAAAHGQGILHRDLKPANLMLTSEGRLKVLDFGLAKAAAVTDAVTTGAGLVLGTPAYMSPEQAAGEPVDRRTDIWAVGCVLFEMLSGRRAFPGPSSRDVLAAVLKGEPDWSAIPAGVTPRLRVLVERCLRRDPRRRWQDAGDIRVELEDLAAESGGPSAAKLPRLSRRTALGVALSGLGAGALGFAAGRWRTWVDSTPSAPTSSPVDWRGELVSSAVSGYHPAVSPDAQWLAYQHAFGGRVHVGVIRLGSGERRVLTDDRSPGNVRHLTWSLDSSRVYYARGGDVPRICSVSVVGGPEQLVLDKADNPQPLNDGSLLAGRLGPDDNVYRVVQFWPDSGRLATTRVPSSSLRTSWGGNLPPFRAFPDGRDVVCVQWLTGGRRELCVVNLESGEVHSLSPDSSFPRTSQFALDPFGREVYVAELQARGELTRIVAVPRGGGAARVVIDLVWPRAGFCIGPDGSVYVAEGTRGFELLRASRRGGSAERLAGSGDLYDPPLALPDGRVLFGETVAGRHRVVAVEPGRGATPVVPTAAQTWLPAARLPEGRLALFIGPAEDRRDLAVVAPDGRVLNTWPLALTGPVQSLTAVRDGRSLVYVLDKQVYILNTSAEEPRLLGPGDVACGSIDGQSIYVARVERERTRLERRPTDDPAKAEPIFVSGPWLLGPNQSGTAATPDGRLLVAVSTAEKPRLVPGELDPVTGEVRAIPLDYDGDVHYPTPGPGDTFFALGSPLWSVIWRYRPAKVERSAGGAS